jgi:6-pyruvoyltetrahydropterin/6-carboxytetrahydropterin synthase
MSYSQYKYNFYLNASHSIFINGNQGERHPHTWQISLYVVNNKDTFMMFNEVEKLIEDYLGQYQEKYINDCPTFRSMNPTLENIAHCFMNELQKILNPLNWVIFTMEISETPSRSYIISNVDNNIIHDVEKRKFCRRNSKEKSNKNGIYFEQNELKIIQISGKF